MRPKAAILESDAESIEDSEIVKKDEAIGKFYESFVRKRTLLLLVKYQSQSGVIEVMLLYLSQF